MLYIFAGEDANRKHIAYEDFLKALPKQTEIFQISRNSFSSIQLESLYSGQGLFFEKCTVVFSDVLESGETRDFILGKLNLMESSPNDFIFLEDKLNKTILDAFKKAGAAAKRINIFEQVKERKEKFNNFLLANALGSRDKLNLWIYFRQAVDLGVDLEPLVGILFWKAKDMILKNNFSKFSKPELQTFAGNLAGLLPEARLKGQDAEAALEQFLLEAF